MMRQWVWARLADDAVVAIFEERRYQATTFQKPPDKKPFTVYRVGRAAREVGNVRSASLYIYVHDTVGDYARIDQGLDVIKEVLELDPWTFDRSMISCEWLERTDDMRDPEFRTNFKYDRYRVVFTP